MDRKITLIFKRSPSQQTIEEFLEKSGVERGWHDLLSDLFNKLFDAGWNGNLMDCKEKFGRLRIYLEAGLEPAVFNQLYEIVREYERLSEQFCEFCGGFPARLRTERNWLKTMCDDCVTEDYNHSPGKYKTGLDEILNRE